MGKIRITFFGALTRIIGEKTIHVEASNLREAINTLIERYGELLKKRIYDEKGKLRRFINIYINGRDVRFFNSLDTRLNDGDEVSIIPAVGGG